MNLTILQGNLGSDIELRTTTSGTSVANGRLATHEYYKDGKGNSVEATEWHRLVFFGKLAEIAAKKGGKGGKLLVKNGRIQTRKWEDKNNVTRYTTEIVVRECTFLDSKEPVSYSGEVPPAITGAPMGDDVPF